MRQMTIAMSCPLCELFISKWANEYDRVHWAFIQEGTSLLRCKGQPDIEIYFMYISL